MHSLTVPLSRAPSREGTPLVHAKAAVIAAAAVLVLAGCTNQQPASTTTSTATTATTVQSTTTTTTTTTPAPAPAPAPPKPSDQQIADAAKQYLLEDLSLGQAGDFKDVECMDNAGNTEDMSAPDCWPPYINSITFSDGVLYLRMDTNWPDKPQLDESPDGARMLKAQNKVATLIRLGPGPQIVMDNVRLIEAVDRNGMTRSKAPLYP
jgi:hypothetical protein